MSGEQAEERTAREGREALEMWNEELAHRAQRVLDVRAWDKDDTGRADKLDAAETRLYSYELPQQILDLLAECSRLASRVEELEKMMQEIVEAAVDGCDYCSICMEDANEHEASCVIGLAQQLLAGAHAEEKE